MQIRTATECDAQRLCEIYSYYVKNTAISFEYDAPDKDEFKRRISVTLKKYPYLVLEEGGEICGYAYAGPFKARAAYDHSCEVSIYVDHDKRKNGYGKALYASLEDKLKEAGIKNMYACIGSPVSEDEYLDNSSETFHRHMGFVTVGTFHKCGYKFGRWYNMIWMEKIIGRHSESI